MRCISCGRALKEKGEFCWDCRQQEIERILKEAKDYLAQLRFPQALKKLEEVLNLDEGHLEARRLKQETEARLTQIEEKRRSADSLFQEGKYKEAATVLNELILLLPTDKDARLKRDMSRLLALTEPRYFARSAPLEFGEWATKKIRFPLATFVLIITSFAVVGLAYFSNYLYQTRIENRLADDIYQRLQRRISLKDYYSAAFLSEYEKLTGDYARTKYAQQAKKRWFKKYQEAKQKKNLLIKEYLNKGTEYFRQGRYKEAIQQWSKVLEWEPSHPLALDYLQRSKAYTSGTPAAPIPEPERETERKIARVAPPPGQERKQERSSPEPGPQAQGATGQLLGTYLKRGQDYFEAGKYDLAREQWELARGLAPSKDRAKIEGFIRKAKMRQAKQQQDYRQAIVQAERYEADGDWVKALSFYRRALEYRPEDKATAEKVRQIKRLVEERNLGPATQAGQRFSRFFRGVASRLGGLFSGLAKIGSSPSQRQKDFEKFYLMAKEEEKKGNYLQANRGYRKAASFAKRALLEEEIRLNRLAIQIQNRLLQNPDDYFSYIVLACYWYVKGYLDKALEQVESVLKGSQERSQLLLAQTLRAKIEEKIGLQELAIADYKEVLESAELYFVRNSLASLLWQEGFQEEAMESWKKILESYPDQLDVLVSLTLAHYQRQELLQARSLAQDLSRLKPSTLSQTQRFPSQVSPEYIVGNLTEKDFLSDTVLRLSQAYLSLGMTAEAVLWRKIYLEMQM
jgi:tetratricopeptide (TPR) repeat protein